MRGFEKMDNFADRINSIKESILKFVPAKLLMDDIRNVDTQSADNARNTNTHAEHIKGGL
jgi:hypothetical protein